MNCIFQFSEIVLIPHLARNEQEKTEHITIFVRPNVIKAFVLSDTLLKTTGMSARAPSKIAPKFYIHIFSIDECQYC